MNNRSRIKQAFTKYGYLDIDAVDPEDEDLLKSIKELYIKMKKIEI